MAPGSDPSGCDDGLHRRWHPGGQIQRGGSALRAAVPSAWGQNVYAFVADIAVMAVSLPICERLETVIRKLPIYKNVSFVNPMKDYIITGNEPYDFSRVIINRNNFDNCY